MSVRQHASFPKLLAELLLNVLLMVKTKIFLTNLVLVYVVPIHYPMFTRSLKCTALKQLIVKKKCTM